MADLPDYMGDMELYFDVPIDGAAEENGMMQIAYAIRALIYETQRTNDELDLINYNLDRIWRK